MIQFLIVRHRNNFFQKLFYFFIINCFILFQHNISIAVTNSEIDIKKTLKVEGENFYLASQFLEYAPENFLGAMLVCNPYCQVLSVKLEPDKWQPDLEKIEVYGEKLTFIDIDDPLFKALFPEKKDAAEKASQLRKDELNKKNELNKKLNANSNNKSKKKDDRPPDPKVAFDNGFLYAFGLSVDNLTQKSEGNVQKNFNPKSTVNSIPIELAYLRNKPFWFFKQWWKLEFEYDLDLISLGTKNQFGDSLSKSTSGYIFTTWLYKEKYHLGLRYKSYNLDYKVKNNQLESYSFNEKTTSIGAIYKTKRNKYYLDYAYKYSINEEQPYRTQLISADEVTVGYEYCQTIKKLIFTNFKFYPCYKFEYLYSTNKSNFSPTYVESGSIKMNRNELILKVMFNLGEDFYR